MSRWLAWTFCGCAAVGAAHAAADLAPSAASTTDLRCTKPPDGKSRARAAASAPGVAIYVNCGAASAAAQGGGGGSAAGGAASGGAGGAASAEAGASGPPNAAPPARPESGAASESVPAALPKDATSEDFENLRLLRAALLWGLAALALALVMYGLGSLLGALGMRASTAKWLSAMVLAFSKRATPLESAAQLLDRDPPADFAFRRHWGSFGGESTGWNMSRPLARLLTGLLMIAIGLWVLLQLLAVASGPKVAPSPASPASAASAATTAPPVPPAAHGR